MENMGETVSGWKGEEEKKRKGMRRMINFCKIIAAKKYAVVQ